MKLGEMLRPAGEDGHLPQHEQATTEPEAEAAAPAEGEKEPTLLGRVNGKMFELLFFDVAGGSITMDEIDRVAGSE